jgi:hypothetical protein
MYYIRYYIKVECSKDGNKETKKGNLKTRKKKKRGDFSEARLPGGPKAGGALASGGPRSHSARFAQLSLEACHTSSMDADREVSDPETDTGTVSDPETDSEADDGSLSDSCIKPSPMIRSTYHESQLPT